MSAPTLVALPGDGIGAEVTAAALEVLEACCRQHGLALEIERLPVGGQALDRYGEPLPDFVLEACLRSGVVLLGAVGEPRFDQNPPHLRPERALLRLRKELDLFANLRPVKTYPSLLNSSPLKPDRVEDVDILIVRELTGGIYFGEPRGLERRPDGRVGFNSEVYHDFEVERITRTACEAALQRQSKVTSVDKANVLESSQLWRKVVEEVVADYPEITLRHMLVDNCAMQLIAWPKQFDVILTTNMFGDILSDEAAMLTGSIGMLPSASLGKAGDGGHRVGLYEPVHGTAPDIAGQNRANPLAAIASVALLLRHSLNRDDMAREIESAIDAVLNRGYRTADLAEPGQETIGTTAMRDRVLEALGA